jgi:hypothetical protein
VAYLRFNGLLSLVSSRQPMRIVLPALDCGRDKVPSRRDAASLFMPAPRRFLWAIFPRNWMI